MIIKIHSRGSGSGSGPVDYLLGKDRAREDARLDRGDPEQMVQLIDSTHFAQKYTSGVLSFAERDLEEHQKQKIMDSFEEHCSLVLIKINTAFFGCSTKIKIVWSLISL